MLGPLTNPAGVQRQLVGTFNQQAAEKIAGVFHQLKPVHVCVVSSEDGLDEISLDAQTDMWQVKRGNELSFTKLEAGSFGLPSINKSQLHGGNADTNAIITMNILNGLRGHHRDVVVINAAMGLVVAGKVATPQDGLKLAEESIDSRKALEKLNALITFTNR